MKNKLIRIMSLLLILSLLLGFTFSAVHIQAAILDGSIADNTGTLGISPTTLPLGETDVTVSVEGTFDVVLPDGVTGVAQTDGWTVTDSPKALASGTTTTITVEVGGTGTIKIITDINPDTIAIGGTNAPSPKVFTDIFEDGDMYFICVGNISYGVEPMLPSTIMFTFNLYDTDGTTLLFSTPVQQYQWDVYGIYVSAYDVDQNSLEPNSAYVLKLIGNPAIFSTLTEDVNMDTVTLDTYYDWFEYSSKYKGTTLDPLYQFLYYCAEDIQDGNSYSPSILTSQGLLVNGTGTATGSPITLEQGSTTITYTGAGTFTISLPTGCTGTVESGTGTISGSPVYLVAGENVVEAITAPTKTFFVSFTSTTNTLSSAGAAIFNVALPRIINIVPNLYNVAQAGAMQVNRSTFTNAYEDELTMENKLGSQIASSFDGVGDFLGISGQLAEAMWGLLLVLFVVSIVFMYTSNTTAGFIAGIPMVIICVWVGAFPMSIIFLITTVIIVYMAYFLFLRGI